MAHPAAAASVQSSPALQQAMQTVQLPQQQLVPVTSESVSCQNMVVITTTNHF